MLSSAQTPVTPRRVRPALIATAVSAGLGVLKGGAWWLTGSTAMLASALDSAGDALVSGLNSFVLRVAARPADRGHPFGHGKVESLAGLVQGVLMAASGIWVVVAAFRRLGEPEPLEHVAWGVAAAVVSLLVAFLLARALARAGREFRSPALEADSRHYATDYVANGGVLLAFAADALLQDSRTDAIISILIAATILKAAYQLLRDAIQALMDSELDTSDVAAIQRAILAFGPTVKGFHDLRTRRSGADRFVQAHIEVDASLSFRDAHSIVERIRREIEERVPGSYVTLHADPWPLDDNDQPVVPQTDALSREAPPVG